ncbi:DoxX family protein [Candidatus Uhrbacteria bacterium]|nr:DoxX family protein [Candidatus Uhrbacteria bacterium]
MSILLLPTDLVSVAFAILRIAVGIIFLVHGKQKMAMWKMQPSEQMPAQMLNMMKMLSVVEPVAGVLLILGVLPLVGAAAVAIIMVGATYFKIAKWGKKFTGDGGWELDFILFAASIAIILSSF